MADLEALRAQLFAALEARDEISEKSMMGGVCFFYRGNMLGGLDLDPSGDGRLMFRVGKQQEAEALELPGVSVVVLGNRRMGGMVFLNGQACNAGGIAQLAGMAFDFVSALPAK